MVGPRIIRQKPRRLAQMFVPAPPAVMPQQTTPTGMFMGPLADRAAMLQSAQRPTFRNSSKDTGTANSRSAWADLASGLGMGLLSGRNWGEGLALGLNYAKQYGDASSERARLSRQDQAAEEERELRKEDLRDRRDERHREIAAKEARERGIAGMFAMPGSDDQYATAQGGAEDNAWLRQQFSQDQWAALSQMAQVDPKGVYNIVQARAFGERDKVTPYSSIGKAQADLQAGLIDQPTFDRIVADELRAPEGPGLTERQRNAQAAGLVPGTPEYQAYILDQGGNSQKPPSASDLRGEYTKAMKDYEQALYGYSKVVEAARNPSPAGDIAMIFGFMKTLDPNSTVREGEFATAQNAGSVPERIMSLYNSVLQGTRLTPAQRSDFIGQAKGQFSTYEQRKTMADQFYTGLAERNQISPEDVLVPFQAAPQFNPPVTPDIGFTQPAGGVVEWERGPDGKPRKKVQ